MNKMAKLIVASLFLLTLTGCLQTTDEFFINPDGSGKVIHEAILTPVDLGFGPNMTPEEKVQDIVQKELEKAEGVEVFKDVSWEKLEDGKVLFKATAYFKDIEALQFHNNGGKLSMLKESLSGQGTDELVLELINEPRQKDPGKAPAALPENLTDEALEAKIAEQKVQLDQMKPLFEQIFGSIKMTKIYHLPGEVLEVKNFSPHEGGAYRIDFDGGKMLDSMLNLMSDTEWIKEQIKAGRDLLKEGPASDMTTNKLLFGEDGPVRLVASGDLQPLFDYKKEVVDAKQSFKQEMQELKLSEPVAIEVGEPTEALDVRVAGAQIVFESDGANDIRPFNWDVGYTLSVILALPEEAVSIEDGKILKAIADDGSDLLPSGTWARDLKFVDLGKDKKTVEFEIKLNLPGPKVQGFREISGALEYMTSPKTLTVNTGINEFAAGSKGHKYSAEILSVGKYEGVQLLGIPSPDSYAIKLKVALPQSQIKDVDVFGPTGFRIKINSKNWAASGSITEYDLVSNEPFPERGRIDLIVHEGVKNHMLSFKLENITLFGKPLKKQMPPLVAAMIAPEAPQEGGLSEDKGADPKDTSTTSAQDTLKVVLNENVAIEIASKHAEAEGKKLEDFPKVKAKYSFTDKVWRVNFKMEPMQTGGWFEVEVEDATGKVVQMRQGL